MIGARCWKEKIRKWKEVHVSGEEYDATQEHEDSRKNSSKGTRNGGQDDLGRLRGAGGCSRENSGVKCKFRNKLSRSEKEVVKPNIMQTRKDIRFKRYQSVEVLISSW